MHTGETVDERDLAANHVKFLLLMLMLLRHLWGKQWETLACLAQISPMLTALRLDDL